MMATDFMSKAVEHGGVQFVALTPHDLDVQCVDGSILHVPASGVIARCEQSSEVVRQIGGIVVARQSFGAVYDLPDPIEGVVFLVSMAVARAVPEREDVMFPGMLNRREDGQPTSCRGLSVL